MNITIPETGRIVRSKLCVPYAKSTLEKLSSKSFVFVNPTSDICNGEAIEKYQGALIELWGLFDICNIDSGMLITRIMKSYKIGLLNNVSGFVKFEQRKNEKKRIPGTFHFLYSTIGLKDDGRPVVHCQYVDGMEQEPNYVKNIIFGNNFSRADVVLQIDSNPWVPILDSPFYFVYFRMLGVFALYLAINSARYSRHLWKKKTVVPCAIQAIESFSLSLLGVNWIAAGHYASDVWPYELQQPLVLWLPFCNMLTSVLSGIYFGFIKKQTMALKGATSEEFIQAMGPRVTFLVFLFVSLDLSSMVALLLWIKNIEIYTGLLSFFIQTIVSISFIRQTKSFLNLTIGTLKEGDECQGKANKTRNRQLQILKNKAKWLFGSAVFMILYILSMPIGAMSGNGIFGFYRYVPKLFILLIDSLRL